QPPPVSRDGKRNPDCGPERPGQVRQAGIWGDHQVKSLDRRGRIHEISQPRAKVDDRKEAVAVRELLGAEAFLKAEKTHPGNSRKWFELRQPERPLAVFLVLGTSLPGNADLESVHKASLYARLIYQIRI